MVKNPLPMQETWVQSLGPEYSSGEANGNLLQYSCLGNPVNREAQQAVVYGVVKESNMTQWTAKKLDFQPGTFWLSQLKQEALPPSSGYRPGMLPSTGPQIMMEPSSVQSSPVAQSCPAPWDPMDHSTSGFPVCHQLLELTQTHVHWVSDVIQPSHPLSSPSAPAFNLSQHQSLFQWVSSSHQVAKVLELQLQHRSFQWIFRVDFL